MDLDTYLWKNRISQKSFSDKINVLPSTLHHWIKMRITPSLKYAIKIVEASNNEVTYRDLLCPKEKAEFLKEDEKNIDSQTNLSSTENG